MKRATQPGGALRCIRAGAAIIEPVFDIPANLEFAMLLNPALRPCFFLALLMACVSSAVQAQAPGLMGTDTPMPSRMPLLMPADFSELKLVDWRVERSEPDPQNPLIEGEMPWDAGGVGIHGSVFKDPLVGRWKAYIVSQSEAASSRKL